MKRRFVLTVKQTTHKRYEFEAEVGPTDHISAEEQAVEQFAALPTEEIETRAQYLDTQFAQIEIAATTAMGAASTARHSYFQNMFVPADEADEMSRACREGLPGCGKDETLFDREVVFSDGRRVAIQVIAGENESPAWTQGVLYSPDGVELCCTEVGEDLLGPYYLYMDQGRTTYCVDVRKTGGKHEGQICDEATA